MHVLSQSGPFLPLTFYIRPNDLPLKGFWILEIRRRDLGLHRVVLTIAKCVKNLALRAFSRKLRVNFQGVKKKKKQSCLKMLLQTMSTKLE